MEKSEQIQPHAWILGIDVSKQSIDVCLIRSSDGQLFESKFHNNLSGFRHLKRWCKEFNYPDQGNADCYQIEMGSCEKYPVLLLTAGGSPVNLVYLPVRAARGHVHRNGVAGKCSRWSGEQRQVLPGKAFVVASPLC